MGSTLTVEREADLLARARSPNSREREAGFAELVRQLGPTLFAICLGVTGNHADAEDAVQESVCAIGSSLSKFRGEARLSTWCSRIAIRAAMRVRAKNAERHFDDAAETRLLDGPDLAESNERAEQLLAAIQQLSAEHRTVLSLFAQGSSQRDIAEILEVPEGTIWSRLHIARKRLHALLVKD